MEAAAAFFIGMLLTLLIITPSNQSKIEQYQQRCRDAGGIPAITAKGPDVCLNPSALIKGVEQ